jgi:hypothetical protein
MTVPLGSRDRRLEKQFFFQIHLIQPATESDVEFLRILGMETPVPLRRSDLEVIRVGRIPPLAERAGEVISSSKPRLRLLCA